MKRVIDIFVSLTIIILLFPIIIVTGLTIRFVMGSPILFKQMRPGLNGQGFYLYKFRTMQNKTDLHSNAADDEARITPLGMFIRKYSLDELPQLFHVLKGEMSLVGPRPLLMDYLALYSEEQRLRHIVKPGITGWAQINGRNAITWEEKFKLDTWYVKNHSTLLDCKIIMRTIVKVLKREGINHQGSVSMKKFEGTKNVR
ncbi:sugar transferase [Lentibacillus sp. N15]|uniref:sugar transferase n=1 Tax=Lentibacillus songyuanensis TaxID=3136161 RepID=UPI0031BA5D8A